MNLQELLAEVLDHIRGMWRFRWFATAVAWVIGIGGFVYVYTMPDVYRASVRIFVDTESLLRPLLAGLTAVDTNLSDLQLLSREILLTRPNLRDVAMRTDLDLRGDLEEIISDLQDDVSVSGGRDNIYTIEYVDREHAKAVAVVDALADTFVEGALGDRGGEVATSEQVLEDEIKLHESRINEMNAALSAFKRENVGFMPDDRGDYYARWQTELGERAATQEALEQTRNSLAAIQRELAGEDLVIGIMPGGAQDASCSQHGDKEQLRSELLGYRARGYLDTYPPIIRINAMIAVIDTACAEELEQARAAGLPTSAEATLNQNPIYQNLLIQQSDAQIAIARLEGLLRAQDARIESLNRNVDRIIKVEEELKAMNRDLSVLETRLQQYYVSWEELGAKKRLGDVADTAQFQIIDPPHAETVPVGPNRPLLIGTVLLLALGTGGALAFVLNQVRPVFFTREKLKNAFEFPVIGSVTMLLPPEVVMRRRVEAATWSFACFMLVVAAGLAIGLSARYGPPLRALIEGAML